MSKGNAKTTSKKTSKSKVKKTRRFLLLGVGSIIIILATVFTIGKYWVEIIEKYREKKELEAELSYLREKEDELKLDADKLQDPDYVARYAREKYLYSKDGELIIRMPDDEEDK